MRPGDRRADRPRSAPDEFDARFDAKARRYRYTVLNRPVPDPFLAATSWHVPQPLDLDRLQPGLRPAHRRARLHVVLPAAEGRARPSLTRRVPRRPLGGDDGEGVLRFWIEATAFCHQMVRAIIGTLVDVGLGKRTAADVSAALRAEDAVAAGPVGPAHGLVLWEVTY